MIDYEQRRRLSRPGGPLFASSYEEAGHEAGHLPRTAQRLRDEETDAAIRSAVRAAQAAGREAMRVELARDGSDRLTGCDAYDRAYDAEYESALNLAGYVTS